DEAQFKECYDTCHKECSDKGNGFTFCEMKCDTDCSVKDVKEKLENYKPKN
uniref:Major pollen allergen Ole e 6 n=2 Tax=Olea europaea TaxID=4146 RepID=ALL6_OLEEU